MLVDIHSHLLPGVDDGAKTTEDSLELARLAVSEGIEHLILTPHHYNNQYVNHKKDVLEATVALQKIYDEADVPLKVHPSQEIRIQENIVENILYSNDYLSLDEKGRYYLIEMPTKTVPDYALDVAKEMLANDMIPVIAHPERNHAFAKNLHLLYQFIEMGCLGQLTSHCYIGFYGEKLRRISQEMIEHNLIHTIASDAHNMKHRPFNVQAAYTMLADEYDIKLVKYFQLTAQSILKGGDVRRMRPKEKRRFGIF